MDNTFAATNSVGFLGHDLDTSRWNITHIPSGYCIHCDMASPEAARKFAERVIEMVGKERYQRGIRRAMNRVKAVKK